MERRRGRAPVVLLVAASGLTASSGVAAPLAPTPVIDRTFRCSIPVWAGLRDITVFAQAGVRENPTKWKSLAAATISTRGSAVSLFGAAAGAPVPTEWKGLAIFDFTLSIGKECRASARRIPLSARGLDGGAADQFGDTYKCTVSRALVVRVRAAFRSATLLRLDARSGSRFTRTPVKAASVAVRTSAGRPIVFANMSESGKAQLFTARGCR